ncbi:hypothetical protein GGR77_003559 [Xanthomonas translucens]
MRRWTFVAGLALAFMACAQAEPPPLDLTPYLKRDQFERVKISPTGAYYAVTQPLEDRTGCWSSAVATSSFRPRSSAVPTR